jgi:AcrR family transcriptional regulator
VRCLCRDGYGATTTDAILKESGVSRGRLLNLFPTKVDLMIAVSRHGWDVSRRHSRNWPHQFDNPVDKARNIVDLSWKIMSDPPGVAVLEILVACRSDDVLAQRFVPEHQRVQQAAIDQARSTFAQLGISETVDADAHHRYLEACIRGLVIDRTFDIAGSETPKALDFIKEQIVDLLPSESCSGGVSDAA